MTHFKVLSSSQHGTCEKLPFGFKRRDIWVLGETKARALRPPLTRWTGVISWEGGGGEAHLPASPSQQSAPGRCLRAGGTTYRPPKSAVFCSVFFFFLIKECFGGWANKWLRSKGEEGGVMEGAVGAVVQKNSAEDRSWSYEWSMNWHVTIRSESDFPFSISFSKPELDVSFHARILSFQ